MAKFIISEGTNEFRLIAVRVVYTENCGASFNQVLIRSPSYKTQKHVYQ
jgi:hypothetical protein